jgi:glycosyltransferase involved in cell wall biosynthesis
MKKILFIIPSLGIGGAEKNLIRKIKNLSKKKYKIAVCTIYPINLFKEEMPENVIYFSGGKPNNIFGRAVALFRLIRFSLNFKPSVINAYLGLGCNYGLYIKLIYSIFKNNKVSLIFSSRNKPGKVRDFSFFWRQVLYRTFSNKIDHITYNHVDGPEDGHCMYGFSLDKSHYIFNGVELHDCMKNKRLHNDIRCINFIYPARFVNQKNHEYLLKNVKHFIDNYNGEVKVKFQLIGDRSNQQVFDNVISFIYKNKLQDYFLINDPVLNMKSQYLNSDVLISSSAYEGFSNILLEAWSFSLPVVVSNEMDSNNLVVNKFNGLKYSLNDNIGLSKKIFELSKSNCSDIEDMGKKGKELVSSKFSFEKEVCLFEKIYNL